MVYIKHLVICQKKRNIISEKEIYWYATIGKLTVVAFIRTKSAKLWIKYLHLPILAKRSPYWLRVRLLIQLKITDKCSLCKMWNRAMQTPSVCVITRMMASIEHQIQSGEFVLFTLHAHVPHKKVAHYCVIRLSDYIWNLGRLNEHSAIRDAHASRNDDDTTISSQNRTNERNSVKSHGCALKCIFLSQRLRKITLTSKEKTWGGIHATSWRDIYTWVTW